MDEQWRSFPSHPSYEISDMGRVRGAVDGRDFRVRYDRDGYGFVRLRRNGQRAEARIHRAVLMAFVGDPPTPASQANHKNFDKTDNSLGNLEWTSPSENSRHAGRSFRNLVPVRFINSLPIDQLTAVKALAEERHGGDWNLAIRDVVARGVEKLTSPAPKIAAPAMARYTDPLPASTIAPCCGSTTGFHKATCSKQGRV